MGLVTWRSKPAATALALSPTVAYGRQGHGGNPGPLVVRQGPELSQEGVAVLARHADVTDQHVGHLLPQRPEPGGRDLKIGYG
jgi:hypothetical protein